MPENKPQAATLELVYVPDVYTETERQEGASWPLGSGFYDLVAVAGDARIPLHRFKAGAIDKLYALAKDRKESQQQNATTSTPTPEQVPPSNQTTTPVQQQQPDQQQAPPPDQQQQQQQG